MNEIVLKIDLPKEVINKLELVIIEAITETLEKHIEAIRAEPKLFSRTETAKKT